MATKIKLAVLALALALAAVTPSLRVSLANGLSVRPAVTWACGGASPSCGG